MKQAPGLITIYLYNLMDSSLCSNYYVHPSHSSYQALDLAQGMGGMIPSLFFFVTTHV